jgi:hypothetical protein
MSKINILEADAIAFSLLQAQKHSGVFQSCCFYKLCIHIVMSFKIIQSWREKKWREREYVLLGSHAIFRTLFPQHIGVLIILYASGTHYSENMLLNFTSI